MLANNRANKIGTSKQIAFQLILNKPDQGKFLKLIYRSQHFQKVLREGARRFKKPPGSGKTTFKGSFEIRTFEQETCVRSFI
jgi:hypothetical protein